MRLLRRAVRIARPARGAPSFKRRSRPLKSPVDTAEYRLAPYADIRLADRPTLAACAALPKRELRAKLRRMVERFSTLQEHLYAESRRALLLVFQGMDAAGKDSTIKNVTSGVNPQGFRITNFRPPTELELRHTWLQRHWSTLPEHGRIGIFNRSHYEEVVTLRVQPELLRARKLTPSAANADFWERRLEDIAAFERHLATNGTRIVKCFLHVSKNEQERRLLARLNDPAKNWKFDPSDLAARDRWEEYAQAYEAAFHATSTEDAPWYVVPADNKPAMRLIIATVVVETLAAMAPSFPQPDSRLRTEIAKAKERFDARDPLDG